MEADMGSQSRKHGHRSTLISQIEAARLAAALASDMECGGTTPLSLPAERVINRALRAQIKAVSCRRTPNGGSDRPARVRNG